jgi:hypothetical protein
MPAPTSTQKTNSRIFIRSSFFECIKITARPATPAEVVYSAVGDRAQSLLVKPLMKFEIPEKPSLRG